MPESMLIITERLATPTTRAITSRIGSPSMARSSSGSVL